MFGIGLPELIVIFVIALLIFGPKKLPELGQTMGKWVSELRRATQDLTEDIQKDLKLDIPNEDVSKLRNIREKEDQDHGPQ